MLTNVAKKLNQARSILLGLMLFVLPLSTAFAQLEVKSAIAYRLADTSGVKQFGNVTLLDIDFQKSGDKVAAFQVISEAANLEVEVSDVNRVSLDPIEVDRRVYLIDKPGHWFIEVRAIDFPKNIYARKKIELTLEGSPGPGPKPPGPGPGPDPPSPVPNTYGIGAIAYQYAPKDPVAAAKYIRIFKAAGDYLFGVPSLKFVTSSVDAHNKDPNRSVHAWIDQQTNLITCTDSETCKAWAAWRAKVNEAFRESQSKRQYSRQDWFNAFGEVAKALEAVK